MAAYDRRLFERSGDVIALVREAGAPSPSWPRPTTGGGGVVTGPASGCSRPGPRAPSATAWTWPPPSTSTRPCATSTSTPC
ncbi:hypothetical protein K7G98_07995 [Saccharothrix sp. MB29]|nr:hypothetical protein [Saccharothrix sp. MB29]